jgi:Nif-specific regulatory protein
MSPSRDTPFSELTLLDRITQIVLDRRRELDVRLAGVLEHLAVFGMERGMITIYDPARRRIQTEVSHGLSSAQRKRGRYRPGEGIVGGVLENGDPVLVPRIGDEPLFLDRTNSRRDLDVSNIAFVCVPIRSRNETIGTLSVDRTHTDGVGLEADLQLLNVIAMIIGEVVRAYREYREEVEALQRENQRLESLQTGSSNPDYIVGNSRSIENVLHLTRQVAPFDTSVLIRGESGTGKELVARAIHESSRRKKGPFVSVNCGALPEQLVASELFGHVRGAYTGADRNRKGRFELADGGTIFLDEIGETSPTIQVKLLRVLQEGEIDRLGDETPRKVDVRVIAATNANLEESMASGAFRQDLFYRLEVFPIYMPPLRERRSDITLLADHFLEKYARLHGREIVRISTPAIELLTSYHWPGNVRELENCVARAVLLAADGVIRSSHLPPTLQTGASSGTTQAGSLEGMMMDYEREILIEAMRNSNGNQARAARALQTTTRILSYRLRKHGLHEGLAARSG